MVPIRCDMHFASYPLDRQECHFKIGSVFAEADEELYNGNWTVLDQVGHPNWYFNAQRYKEIEMTASGVEKDATLHDKF